MSGKIFLGYDAREAVGFHVCVESIIKHARYPFTLSPLHGARRDGTNDFTYARFMIPYLCRYTGSALFIDGSDMFLREDIAEIFKFYDPAKAVSVVKHNYRTRHPRKYLGTELEADNRDYPRKNWSSVVMFNCAHPANAMLTPQYIESYNGAHLHGFHWLSDNDIGEIDPRWNVLIGEDDDDKDCALAHFTLGIPSFPRYTACRYADEWLQTFDRMTR